MCHVDPLMLGNCPSPIPYENFQFCHTLRPHVPTYVSSPNQLFLETRLSCEASTNGIFPPVGFILFLPRRPTLFLGRRVTGLRIMASRISAVLSMVYFVIILFLPVSCPGRSPENQVPDWHVFRLEPGHYLRKIRRD